MNRMFYLCEFFNRNEKVQDGAYVMDPSVHHVAYLYDVVKVA